jgi:hypothetical protein
MYKQEQPVNQTGKGVQEYNTDDSSESMMMICCGATDQCSSVCVWNQEKSHPTGIYNFFLSFLFPWQDMARHTEYSIRFAGSVSNTFPRPLYGYLTSKV